MEACRLPSDSTPDESLKPKVEVGGIQKLPILGTHNCVRRRSGVQNEQEFLHLAKPLVL